MLLVRKNHAEGELRLTSCRSLKWCWNFLLFAVPVCAPSVCNPADWPNVDHGYVCDGSTAARSPARNCAAVIDFPGAGVSECAQYCAQRGLECIAQYHDGEHDSCEATGDGNIGCAFVAHSSDNICECRGAQPLVANIFGFTGPDPVASSELAGNFVFNVNIRGRAGVKIPESQFADSVASFAVNVTNDIVPVWVPTSAFEYPDSDDGLQLLMHSIRRTPDPSPLIAVVTLTPGIEYRMHLVFHEQCCSNDVEVLIDDELIVGESSPQQDGAEIYYGIFVAQSSTVIVRLGVTDEAFADKNPILKSLALAVDLENRTLFDRGPIPLVYRLLVDFHRNQGRCEVIYP